MRERLRRRAGPGSLPAARRDQRRPHLRPRRPRHRLVADRRPLRPAGPPRPLADRRAQPRGRGRRARRPRRRAGRGRPARRGARRLPRLPRDPRRPAAPARPQRQSRAAYDRAIELAGNTAEPAYLTRRRDQLGGPAARPQGWTVHRPGEDRPHDGRRRRTVSARAPGPPPGERRVPPAPSRHHQGWKWDTQAARLPADSAGALG